MPCPVGDCFSSYVVIEYNNPTSSTKSSISITSLVLFVTFTLQLLFAWFPACVCDCVTNFAFCHLTLRIDYTFLKIKLYLQIGFISRKLLPTTQKPIIVSQVCLIPPQSFFSSHGFLQVLVLLSHIFPFLHSVLSLHPWKKCTSNWCYIMSVLPITQ